MIQVCEGRQDVERYAWFTGRWDNDIHFTQILLGNGILSDLGNVYTRM